jgi:RNA polymerase sporulation-specific sigma factor
MYKDYSDEKLIKLVQKGERTAEDELISRYKNLVRNRARKYFLAGGETEDLIQEGMIGLYKSIRDYDETKNAAFFSFAYNCITKKIMSAIKNASRLKHLALNVAVNLTSFGVSDEQEKQTLVSKLSPEDIIIEKEDIEELQDWLDKILSKFECIVLNMYLEGLSYNEMSAKLKKSVKAIDNSLARAKKKIKNSISY